MKLEDFLVMIGLKLLVKGYLENTLRYTTPFKNSENSVMTQALIYLRHQSLSPLNCIFVSSPKNYNCQTSNGV